MDSYQRVNFPPARCTRPCSLAIPALLAATAVVLAVGALIVGALPALLGFVSLVALLACRGVLRRASRAGSRILVTWAIALSAMAALAVAALPLQLLCEERAEGRFQTAMAPLLDELRRAEAAGRIPDAIDERAAELRLRQALPRAPRLHVVFQAKRERLRWPGDLVVEIDRCERVTKVKRGDRTDTAATERWRGRPADELRRHLGPPTEREAPHGFDGPWRLLVIRRDQALVYESGQEPPEYGIGPWRQMDVCKNGLLDWDDNPERFRSDP